MPGKGLLIQPFPFIIYKGKTHLLRFIEDNHDYLGFVRNMNKILKRIGTYKTLQGKEITDNSWNGKKVIYSPLFPNLTSYWARHTWASLAFEIGIPKDTISLALGHSNGVKVTDIYIKYDQEIIDNANRKVIDFIMGKS